MARGYRKRGYRGSVPYEGQNARMPGRIMAETEDAKSVLVWAAIVSGNESKWYF